MWPDDHAGKAPGGAGVPAGPRINPMRPTVDALNLALRCGARTRSGRACAAPAVHGRASMPDARRHQPWRAQRLQILVIARLRDAAGGEDRRGAAPALGDGLEGVPAAFLDRAPVGVHLRLAQQHGIVAQRLVLLDQLAGRAVDEAADVHLPLGEVGRGLLRFLGGVLVLPQLRRHHAEHRGARDDRRAPRAGEEASDAARRAAQTRGCRRCLPSLSAERLEEIRPHRQLGGEVTELDPELLHDRRGHR